MPILPCALAHPRIASADDQHHAFCGPRRAIPRLDLAAPLLLHAVPRAATQREGASRKRLRRYRHAADPYDAGAAAMTTTADAPRPALWRRVLAFALDIWAVLRRPSAVFSLGVLVMAGFVAGIVFWGAFN